MRKQATVGAAFSLAPPKIPEQVRAKFLGGLVLGCSPTFCAAACGYVIEVFQAWYKSDPTFAQAWENAAAEAAMGLEGVARTLAENGNTEMLKFLLAATLPQKYDARIRALYYQAELEKAAKSGSEDADSSVIDAVFKRLDEIEAARVSGDIDSMLL